MVFTTSTGDFTIENNIIKGCIETSQVKEKSIGELILNILRDNSDHVGQIEAYTGNQTTFGEMRENIIRCALWMQKEGIKSSDVVVVCTEIQMDAYIPYFATFLIGATQNPWSHEENLKTTQYFMQLTKPKLIFASEISIDILMKAAELENHDTKFIVFGNHPKADSLRDIIKLYTKEEVINFQLPKINPDDIALILLTSGTTGTHKAVQHSFHGVFENKKVHVNASVTNSIFLWYSSLFWITGSVYQFQAILSVSTRIIHKYLDLEDICKCIEKYKVECIFLNKKVINRLSKSNFLSKYDFSSVKIITIGGSRMSCGVLEDFKRLTKIPITILFGSTELFTAISIQTSKSVIINSSGFVLPNFQVKIIDFENHKALGPNEPGEFCVKAPWKFCGYLKNEAATKEFIDHEGWMHTGDLAYYAENGEFVFIDRKSEMIKVSGHHVSPSEIEEKLMRHPAVLDAIVTAFSHKLYTETPVALVKIIPKMEVTEEELIKLSSELGTYKTLSHVKFLDEIPYTTSIKLNRTIAKQIASNLIVTS